MKYNKYKIEDINIADEVYFDSTQGQSNHDLYWKVIQIMEKEKQLIVQLDEMCYQTNAPRHCKQWTTEQRQTESQIITAPTKKAGLRVPKTVL